MAVKGTFPIRVESNLQGLGFVLRSVVCEWLLLFLLLLDAAFSYLITKFVHYCELQLPCLICSRLDHVLGKEKPDFYKELLCSDHKSEISSLVLCNDHDKLADIHGMCEECLLSFANKETNEETYKLLVGKLGPDCLQKPFSSMDSIPGSFMIRPCSCCCKPWKPKPYVQKLVHSRPSTSTAKPDIPLPKSPRYRCLNRQEGLKKRKHRFSVSTTPFVLGNMDYDAVSRMGYTEVKITSDSESDFLLSDDDDIITASRGPQSYDGENLFLLSSELLPKRQNDYYSPIPQILKSAPASSILMRPDLEPEKGETTTPKFLLPNGNLKHNLTDINWQQVHQKIIPEISEITSLEEIPLSSNAQEISTVISTNEFDRSSLSKKLSGLGLVPVKHPKDNWLNTKAKSDIGLASAMNNWESIDLNGTTTWTQAEMNPTRKISAVMTRSCSDRDLRDLEPSTSKEVKTSDFLLEHQIRDCNVAGLAEEKTETPHKISSLDKSPIDKNPLEKTTAPHRISSFDRNPMEISAAPYRNLSLDGNPVTSDNADNPQKFESHGSVTSVEPQILSKLPSIERSPSLESQEGSVGEIEGENDVDRLRREIEHGKKRISDLYKELEEERSAAAIAANQAMAMITKLQEEKAALHMEALQYLRMMEEQAEYDVDELEKANDTIAEKEKEIQDLEAELDFYRIKYPEDFPEYSENIGMDLEDAHSSYVESVEFEKS